MAYTTPTAGTAGQVLTATNYNVLVNDVIQVATLAQGVFTNEAARDAAITSPTEGMHAYLTASTVAAATGLTTAVPTGVQTIYNGAAWVCVTPVAAFQTGTGTTTSTSYTATLSGSPGTNPSVTLSTGTTALITIGAAMYNAQVGQTISVSCAVSGATTLAASDNNRYYFVADTSGAYERKASSETVITGLTAGTNTFTLNYNVGFSTGTWNYRSIKVVGIA
jgi:hypothetical protein